MSDKDKQSYPDMSSFFNGQVPLYGFSPYGPIMYPGHMPHITGTDNPSYHDYMHAMAMQHAQMLQQAAQYQAMMAEKSGMNSSNSPLSKQTMAGGPQNSGQAHENGDPFSDSPMMQQVQAMLEGAMGEEEAGIFKQFLGSFGMNDKEFWKGALVGAAAALVLSNEGVRKGLMGLLSGTGDMIKSGGASVKKTATSTASTVKDNVAAGSEIFRDTYQAGKEGFKESVARRKTSPTEEPEANDDPTDGVDA
ncbi:MAG: hypothetical protein CENE_01449 [Candidatus Celerinatantimonas neptuna]|nr:MAG: hypothetical protein CENE_01449 [Candidatus Celerinatantimonas neptuna]